MRASVHPHPTVKFYDIKCVINTINSPADSNCSNLRPKLLEDESDDNDNKDDWLAPDLNEPAATPSETLDVDNHTEFYLNSRMVHVVLADHPLVEEASSGAADGATDVEMFDEEEGGTFELAEWV